MTAPERSAGLAAAARLWRDDLIALGERVLDAASVEVTAMPAPGSVMMELAGEIGSFCFTEVVVTTASVCVDGASGWGCVMGYDREAALAAAVLDARATDEVESFAKAALAAEEEERMRLSRALAGTRI
ncbi:MAG TPA: phosphonate C-P lyase system protein PhnG [Candidatus Acidoferrales bacterium]|nr:phosphonate C-P lyase system protein PhnG [Candidatus Acidoferrales bacterium]